MNFNILNNEIETRGIRHGECVILPIDEIPADAQQVYNGDRFIVAHSETGHHHTVVGAVTMFRPAGADTTDIFMRVSQASRIEHQKSFDKHETKDVLKGNYVISTKREYDYFAKMITAVRD